MNPKKTLEPIKAVLCLFLIINSKRLLFENSSIFSSNSLNQADNIRIIHYIRMLENLCRVGFQKTRTE
jgi:hypothetical protein